MRSPPPSLSLSPSSASIPPREKSRVKLCGVRSAVGRITEVKLFPSWRLARGNTHAHGLPYSRDEEEYSLVWAVGARERGEYTCRGRERGMLFQPHQLDSEQAAISSVCRTTVAACCGAQNEHFPRSKRALALGLLSLAHTTLPSLPKRLSINS